MLFCKNYLVYLQENSTPLFGSIILFFMLFVIPDKLLYRYSILPIQLCICFKFYLLHMNKNNLKKQ